MRLMKAKASTILPRATFVEFASKVIFLLAKLGSVTLPSTISTKMGG